jgi:carbon-monoxide dehydrogenase medium subunit
MIAPGAGICPNHRIRFCRRDLMKPSRFEYRAPEPLDEAVGLPTAERGAKPIAGGQSLMPLLAFRLAAPTLLVDPRRLPGLGDIIICPDGIRLGAKVRWRDIEDDPQLARAQPLLRAAVAHIPNYQIRNCGTIGGSLAHADPSAELPAIAITCGGEIAVFGAGGGGRSSRPSSLQGR